MKKINFVSINNKIKKFNKTIMTPPDKSLSIRVLLFASQCIGVSNIKNLLESEDVLDCIQALRKLKVIIIKKNDIYEVYGNGLGSFRANKRTKIFIK